LSPIAHHDPVQWLTTMHVNVNAPFLLTRHLLGLLRCGTEPAILFAADGEQREPKAYWGAYAVAKHALAGFATVLAEEHGPTRGLRVCTLEFGPLATGLRQAAYPGENPRRWPAPERVANAFVYALGPEGRDLHGRTLQVLARKCDDLGKFQADPAPDIDGAD
jgi:NAD(P)-dependent dehydrogenase (short-subunit alcohol dehydrogenase family)